MSPTSLFSPGMRENSSIGGEMEWSDEEGGWGKPHLEIATILLVPINILPSIN